MVNVGEVGVMFVLDRVILRQRSVPEYVRYLLPIGVTQMIYNQKNIIRFSFLSTSSYGAPYDSGLNPKPTQHSLILFNARITC